MARDHSTFGGTHRPVPRDGRARSLGEARDRAGFDNTPNTGGCAAVMITSLALAIALLIGALG